jgi:hypothetical protein
MLKRVVCLCLVLSQMGCRSVYRFHCTSYPSEAGVLVADEMMGETPCDVRIPRDSDAIQDGKVEFVFCLPDGREKKQIVDLQGSKPSNPAAELVAAPFVLGGVLLLGIAFNDDDDSSSATHDDDDENDRLVTGLVGAGSLGIGAALYYLLCGTSKGMSVHTVDVNFDESPEGPKSSVPASPGAATDHPAGD